MRAFSVNSPGLTAKTKKNQWAVSIVSVDQFASTLPYLVCILECKYSPDGLVGQKWCNYIWWILMRC